MGSRSTLVLVLLACICQAAGSAAEQPPVGVIFQTDTLYRSDNHGDNWCITWASDDSQITSLCDGDWLGSKRPYHNHLYRIIGGPDAFSRHDLPSYPDLSGKEGSWFGYGIVSVDGILYSVISKTPGESWSGPFRGIKLLKSPDNGKTWYRVNQRGPERPLGPRDDARNEVNADEMFFLEEFGLPHQSRPAYPFSYVDFVPRREMTTFISIRQRAPTPTGCFWPASPRTSSVSEATGNTLRSMKIAGRYGHRTSRSEVTSTYSPRRAMTGITSDGIHGCRRWCGTKASGSTSWSAAGLMRGAGLPPPIRITTIPGCTRARAALASGIRRIPGVHGGSSTIQTTGRLTIRGT
jgi:hypothetical protein